jgi:hypothetical protein
LNGVSRSLNAFVRAKAHGPVEGPVPREVPGRGERPVAIAELLIEELPAHVRGFGDVGDGDVRRATLHGQGHRGPHERGPRPENPPVGRRLPGLHPLIIYI